MVSAACVLILGVGEYNRLCAIAVTTPPDYFPCLAGSMTHFPLVARAMCRSQLPLDGIGSSSRKPRIRLSNCR